MSMIFKVGDRVIHPRHGLGQVTKMAMKQFVEGEKHPFYEIAFPVCTLWVPLDLTNSGIRKLSAKTEIASCRLVLKAPPELLEGDYRLRRIELDEQVKEGTITARCKVVRDLGAYGWNKPLSASITAFLRIIQQVLYQEWAAVEGITPVEAATEIQLLLEKGKLLNVNR